MLGGRGNIMIPSSENNNNDVKARTPTPHHSTSPIPMRIIPKTLQPSSPSTKIPASAWKILAILSCIATMVMYAETMLIPAIPDLIKDFNVSYSTSAWILTTYLLVGAVMTPISGKLSDIYGKKKMLLIIMIIYLAGVSIAGFATSIYFLIIARAIQGVGMSMFPIAFSIIRDQFPREKISIGQGVITSMFASGAVIGLSVGGTIIKHYGWEATFFSIIPVAVALLIIIWRFVHVDEGKTLTPQLQQPQQSQPEQLEYDNPRQKQEEMEPAKAQRTEKRIGSSQKGDNNSIISKSDKNTTIDIKGAITLAITVTSFLLVLTFMETGNNSNTTSFISPDFRISYSWSYFVHPVHTGRAKKSITISRFKADVAQDNSTCKSDDNDYRIFYVYGISDHTHIGKKPTTAWIWRGCCQYRECPVALCASTVGIWAYLRFHNIKTRVSKTNYSWFNYYCKRFPWPIDIPFK